MFLGVLLAAGGVALEREEHTLARLIRGLVSREVLLAEKIGLAAACSFAVALAMLAGVGAFVSLDWSRLGLWVVALAVRRARVRRARRRRSARSRATCALPRCSPFCSRCRSRSSRSSRPAPSAMGSTT